MVIAGGAPFTGTTLEIVNPNGGTDNKPSSSPHLVYLQEPQHLQNVPNYSVFSN